MMCISRVCIVMGLIFRTYIILISYIYTLYTIYNMSIYARATRGVRGWRLKLSRSRSLFAVTLIWFRYLSRIYVVCWLS